MVVRSNEGKNVSKNGYLRTISAAIAFAASVTMLACGGDLAPGPDPVTPTGTTTLAALEVTAGSTSLEAKAGQSTNVTVTAIDANRRALADVPISLSSSSGVLSGASTTTDSNGRITATLGLGSDLGNRDVTVRASSGSVAGAVTVQVSGATTSLTASPTTAQTPTTAVDITASVSDAAKVAMGGVGVSFSTTGGTLSSASAVTDGSGTAKVTLTGVTANVRVTATAANASATVDVLAGSTAIPSPTRGRCRH